MKRITFRALSFFVFLSAILLVAIPAFAASGAALEGGFKTIPAIILLATILLFIVVGFMNKAEGTEGYYAAGRSISRVGSGAAIASNWIVLCGRMCGFRATAPLQPCFPS